MMIGGWMLFPDSMLQTVLFYDKTVFLIIIGSMKGSNIRRNVGKNLPGKIKRGNLFFSVKAFWQLRQDKPIVFTNTYLPYFFLLQKDIL